MGFQGVARVAGQKVPLTKFFVPAGPLSPTFQTPPHRIPPPGAVTGSKPQIAISKFSSSELRHPTRILASSKCSKSTLARIAFFRSKERPGSGLCIIRKIEHRVVVGPDPLIVGSSAAGHHHILDAAHPSRQAAQGLSRLEAGPERGRQGVLSARGRRAATREAFVTAFAILQEMGSECRGVVTCHSHEACLSRDASDRNCRFIRVGI